MRISIALYLISIYCCICNEDNLEIQKESGLFRRSECARRFLHVNITNHHLEIREVLSNIKENIQKLGNENLEFPLIQVTGSHGKGSTVLKISEALTNAGYTSGSYTKPYPTFEERFRVNGIKMPNKEMCEIFKKLEMNEKLNFKSCNPNRKLIIICLTYLSMNNAEIGVIEAHIGGIYDGTNYLSPILNVVTNHFLEHIDELGGTIKKIGMHKCGIIKHKLPIILGHAINSQTLDIYSRNSLAPITIIYPTNQNYTFDELNSKTAAEACYILKSTKFPKLTKYSIEYGMSKRISGRMQIVPLANQKGLIDLQKYPSAVIVDYPTGVSSFKLLFREIKQKYPNSKIRVILATPKERDHLAIFKYIFENVDYLHLVGCVPGSTIFECYHNLEETLLQLSAKFRSKWIELKSDLDRNSYEFFKVTIEYAFKLSAQNINNEVILLTQIIGPIRRVFNLTD